MEESSDLQDPGLVLGFLLSQGKRALGPERKAVITSIAQPGTKRGLREFLGALASAASGSPGTQPSPNLCAIS